MGAGNGVGASDPEVRGGRGSLVLTRERPARNLFDPAWWRHEQALALLAKVLAGPRGARYRVASNSRSGAFHDMEAVHGDVLCGARARASSTAARAATRAS